jgi:hypothetical protein
MDHHYTVGHMWQLFTILGVLRTSRTCVQRALTCQCLMVPTNRRVKGHTRCAICGSCCFQLTLAYLEDQFVGFFLAIPDADALGSSLMVEEHGDMIGGTLACHVF